MEQLIDFIRGQWLFIVVALIGIIIAVKLVKSVLKWLIIIAIVVVLGIYGFNFVPIT